MASPNPIFGDLIKALLLQNLRTCTECRRPNVAGNTDAGDWVVKTFLAIPIGAKCPDCQSLAERAECAIRQASGINYKIEGFQLVEDPTPKDGSRRRRFSYESELTRWSWDHW
jgi:hypothetical protein